jgi:hypothetical protein
LLRNAINISKNFYFIAANPKLISWLYSNNIHSYRCVVKLLKSRSRFVQMADNILRDVIRRRSTKKRFASSMSDARPNMVDVTV